MCNAISGRDKYIKKVDRAQSWDAFVVASTNENDAQLAGYTALTTAVAVDGKTTTASSKGYQSSYSTAYGQSVTESFNGKAAFEAKQIADAKTKEFQESQYKIRNKISEGYLKTNSIANEVHYTGFLNIKYSKVESIEISIPINGELYVFNL